MRTVKDLIAELQKYDPETPLNPNTNIKYKYLIRSFFMTGTKPFRREVSCVQYIDNPDKHLYEKRLEMSKLDKRRKEDVGILTKNIKEAENAKPIIFVEHFTFF